MTNLNFRLLINTLLFLLMIIFLLVSLNHYFTSKAFKNQNIKNYVSIFQIDVANENRDFVTYVDSSLTSDIIRDLLINKLSGVDFDVKYLDSDLFKLRDLYTYGSKFTLITDEANRKKLFEKFDLIKENMKDDIKIIFETRQELLNYSYQTSLQKSKKNFDSSQLVKLKSQLSPYFDCENYIINDIIQVELLQQEFDIKYEIKCFDENTDTDFFLSVNLIPFYETNTNLKTYTTAYIFYVFITFLSGLLLVFINMKFITNLNSK